MKLTEKISPPAIKILNGILWITGTLAVTATVFLLCVFLVRGGFETIRDIRSWLWLRQPSATVTEEFTATPAEPLMNRTLHTRTSVTEPTLKIVRACQGVALAYARTPYEVFVERGKLFEWNEVTPCVEEAIQ